MFDIGNSWQAIENRAQKHHFSSTFSIRYVAYYEKMKSNGRVLPEAVPLMLTQIQITGEFSIAMPEVPKTTSGLMYCGRGDGSDFSVEVDQVTTNLQKLRNNFDFFSFFFLAIGLLTSKGRGNTIFSADFGNMLNCKPEYDAGIDLLTIQVIQILRQSLFQYRNQNTPFSSYLDCELSCNPWRHQSTFPVLVTTGTPFNLISSLIFSWDQVPKNYEKCPFYFWFHTAFVKDNSLILTRYADRHQT